MASIAAPVAQLLSQELQRIFSDKADSVTTADGQVQEVGVTVNGVVGHTQFLPCWP